MPTDGAAGAGAGPRERILHTAYELLARRDVHEVGNLEALARLLIGEHQPATGTLADR